MAKRKVTGNRGVGHDDYNIKSLPGNNRVRSSAGDLGERELTAESAALRKWIKEHGPASVSEVYFSLIAKEFPGRSRQWTSTQLYTTAQKGIFRVIAGGLFEWVGKT